MLRSGMDEQGIKNTVQLVDAIIFSAFTSVANWMSSIAFDLE